jgi:hypothetical protein
MASNKNQRQRGEKKAKSALKQVVTREYTINLHKRIHGMSVLLFINIPVSQKSL